MSQLNTLITEIHFCGVIIKPMFKFLGKDQTLLAIPKLHIGLHILPTTNARENPFEKWNSNVSLFGSCRIRGKRRNEV